ncbi:hypothetical protein LKV13_00355 [Borrelia sp. BU AG58]|uniref:hypothetical protein n=1 Tax=Borrelia sp. BU AG58 TaxID=2887345 RepID=UPI001E2AA0AB|nr:hypothetical protein [Borrelia sp. BU AG58]UER67289.1 hypothetical protein LKV13_00355 [Borrelia sp. BU AG58]
MTNNLTIYLLVNNLLLIHFIGIEDIKIKDNRTLTKKYLTIIITSLLIYSLLFYFYNLLVKHELLFIMPIIYVAILYITIIGIKALNNILIVYNKSKCSNDFLLSSSGLVAIIFFALEKNHGFLEGIGIIVLSSLSVLISLMLIILIKRNFEKRLTSKILENEATYFFIMFILSLIPNIIILINSSESL